MLARGGPRGGPGSSRMSPAHSARSSRLAAAPLVTSASALPPTPATHTVGTKKVLQVMRENGSFGFVVKGCNPAYIETVDDDGPADMAGLTDGDFILKLNGLDVRHCDHDHLIQLLQESGSTPTLQILRCQAIHQPVLSPAGSLTSLNTSSSESSHASDLMPFEHNHVDSEGKTFTQHADFLLTSKERLHLKRALQQYELNRDVVGLQASLELVLDTPTKCMLWKFILVCVQPLHHDYILHRVALPSHILTELTDQPNSGNMNVFSSHSHHGSESATSLSHPPVTHSSTPNRVEHLPEVKYKSATNLSHPTSSHAKAGGGAPATFQNHIDFLLTSTERVQFKTVLDGYQENQDLQPVMEVMGLILDTPSKRVLWRYVLPRLTPAHQGVVRKMMDLPESAHSVSGLSMSGMDSYIGSYDENSQHVDTATNTDNNTDDDVLYGTEKGDNDVKDDASSSEDENESTGSDSVSGGKPVKLKPGGGARGREDQALLEELMATRRAVEEVKEAIRGNSRDKDNENDDDDDDEDATPNLDAKHFVTIIPVGYPGFDISRRPFYSKGMDSPEFNKLRKFAADKRGGDADATKASLQGIRFRKPDDRGSGSDSDSEMVCSVQASPRDGGFPLNLSLNGQTLVALKELDDVMAAEDESLSDSDTVTSPSGGHHPLTSAPEGKARASVTFSVPPPPAPPLPPPLPDYDLGGPSHTQMNVKRINWEKLDNKKVENTIWEQLCDTDLSEVIRYLELESHFSTKPAKPTLMETKREPQKSGSKEKKKEVCIMNSKKAYNISILLGHLKMSVPEIRQAVYLMDEETLTPELLQQLITYAPSKQEIAHYDDYTGEIGALSKPDQFSHEMSRVLGYEQRLKALLFKANFRERVEEMKENLRSIRVASNELRHSKKLARLLELILAMGNYMNQGNTRVGEAAGFRITFLTQLDITKTADSKSTFLHVLAETCYNKFPDLLTLAEDVGTLTEAAKVSSESLNEDLHDLRTGLHEISVALDQIGHQGHSHSTNDHFQDVMGHFISEASDAMRVIMALQAGVTEEFGAMVTFFGEDPHLVTTTDIFNIFRDFLDKLERAHRHNMMYKRH